LASRKSLLVGQFTLSNTNAVSANATSGFDIIAEGLLVLLAKDVLHLRSNIGGHWIVVLGNVLSANGLGAVGQKVAGSIEVGLGCPLEALNLIEGLILEWRKARHRGLRHLEWL